MCPLDVHLDDIADLARPKSLTRLGLGPMRPTQIQWADTQPVGERLWRDGATGILSPSAAHEGHTVLTVFRTGPDVPGVVEATPIVVHAAIPRIPTDLRTQATHSPAPGLAPTRPATSAFLPRPWSILRAC